MCEDQKINTTLTLNIQNSAYTFVPSRATYGGELRLGYQGTDTNDDDGGIVCATMAPPLARRHFFLGSKIGGKNMKNPHLILAQKSREIGGKKMKNTQKMKDVAKKH